MTIANDTVTDTVRECWSEILDVPAEEVNDASEFFVDGGDSLLAVELAVAISERLGVEVELDNLFIHGTFAALVDATRRAIETSAG